MTPYEQLPALLLQSDATGLVQSNDQNLWMALGPVT
mgnify:CR=1 FL=1